MILDDCGASSTKEKNGQEDYRTSKQEEIARILARFALAFFCICFMLLIARTSPEPVADERRDHTTYSPVSCIRTAASSDNPENEATSTTNFSDDPEIELK